LGYTRGDLNDSLASLQKSYDVATRIHYDDGRRTALSYIANVYADASVANYDKAIEYYRDLLQEHQKSDNRVGISDTLFNIGSTYERKGDFLSALVWYRRGLAAEERLGRKDEAAYVKRSIGITLAKLNRAAEALPLFDDALRQFTKSGDGERTAEVRQSRGIAYRKLGRINEAIADLEASAKYFAGSKNDRFLEKSKDEVALAYAAAHRWEDAFRARSEDATLQRTLADKLREEHTSRLKVQFDSEKKEQENRALARESSLRERALEAAHRIDRLQKIILILGAILIVALIWLVVRHVRDARRMRTMALTDELTRLPNRRRIVAAGDALLRQTASGGGPLTVVAFDIDHFKRINDTWGHGAGDTVLQHVAYACRGAVRPSDILGRTGGEEFTVLLPATHLAGAVQVAERLRETVEALDFTDIDPSLRVTISLGVAEWTPSDTTLAKLTGRADEVLYRAKNGGRNRVELAVA
ncbi:MAG: tetratricopeptide repeat-containing diguanylate cyclase, partial [Thermoanaerobaculia bacterium]